MLDVPCSNEWQVSTWSVCAGSSCVLVLGAASSSSSCGDGSPFHSWDGGEDAGRWRRGAVSPCSSFCKMRMNQASKQSINQSINQSTTQSINLSINQSTNQSIIHSTDRCTQSSHFMEHRETVVESVILRVQRSVGGPRWSLSLLLPPPFLPPPPPKV